MFLNNSLFKHSSLSALMIIGGIVLKNSSAKLGFKDHKNVKQLSMFLFIGGWLYASYALSVNRQDCLPIIMASFVIVATVTFMKTHMDQGNEPSKTLSGIFILAWIALGYSIGNHLNGNLKYCGLGASALVLGSMMVALPYERKQCLVDGPGMPMFVIAWGIIIILNSMR